MALYIVQLSDVPSQCSFFAHSHVYLHHVGKLASKEVLFTPSGIRNRAFKSILQ